MTKAAEEVKHMNTIVSTMEKQLSETEGEIEKREVIISKMEDNLTTVVEQDGEFCRNEIVKIKNDMKQLKGDNDLGDLKEEFRQFKENMEREVEELKTSGKINSNKKKKGAKKRDKKKADTRGGDEISQTPSKSDKGSSNTPNQHKELRKTKALN